jgi:hypothetical protein
MALVVLALGSADLLHRCLDGERLHEQVHEQVFENLQGPPAVIRPLLLLRFLRDISGELGIAQCH